MENGELSWKVLKNCIFIQVINLYTHIFTTKNVSLENSFVLYDYKTCVRRGLVLVWADKEIFVQRTQKMTWTFVHTVEKNIINWHEVKNNTLLGSSMACLFCATKRTKISTISWIMLIFNDIVNFSDVIYKQWITVFVISCSLQTFQK